MKRNRVLFIGIGAGVMFWVIDPGIDTFIFKEYRTLAESMFSPGPMELWMRSLVVFLFIAFGLFAQSSLNTQKKIQAELNEYKEHLEKLVEVRTKEIQLKNEALEHEIAERKKTGEKLLAFSLTDELTGLSNRRGFFSLAEHFFKIAKRQKQGIFMLYADLDNLKEINDTFGHNEGDNALIDIADILKASYRESDIIARIGGDEFVVVPAGTTNTRVDIITARLQKQLDIDNAKSNRSYKLSMSTGIACYDPENPSSVDELLSQADKSMYEHKKRKPKSSF